MRSEVVRKTIEKSLKNYKTKTIKISSKEYTLYIVPELCDEDLNVFEGFLLADIESKSELSFLKSKYRPPVSGYVPRIGLIFYDGHLLIKDYRRNKHIIKTLRKTNRTFLNKLKNALTQPNEDNFEKLFDRTDIIEEFYILFRKSREYLLRNVSGISDEEKRREFVDNFMMQMLTLWYLQERGFFNSDPNYFITKFRELTQKKLFNDQFSNYYEFLTYFFEKISNNVGKQYYEDDKVGKVVVVGPGIFINGEQKKAISIPDKCFYKDGLTEILVNTPPRRVGDEVPLLNLFESRDWTEGNIDEFVLGAIFEKLMNYDERKKTGAYYTPEDITFYITKNTIEPYLIDRVNEKFNEKFDSIDQIIENGDKKIILYLFGQLKEIKILDPAAGSGHFLGSAIDVLLSIYEKIWQKAKELGMKKGFTIITANEKGEIEEIELLEVDDEEKFRLLVKFFIILSRNIYGVDINPSAIKVARARLFLTLAKHFKVGKEKDTFIRFPNVHFNLRTGNSLIGYIKPEKEGTKDKNEQLFLFVQEEPASYIVEKIKVVEDLKPYLEKTAKSLKIDGNIIKAIENLNNILSKKNIDWKVFERVLKTKENLIRILMASLNSQHAVPLNDLLREITNLFNQKLDEKLAEEYKIELTELKKIKAFHWFFEFPEVFLDRNGFDIVIGNPPYVRQEEINHIVEGINYKEILSKIYDPFDNTFDLSMFFILRSLQITKEKGYHSFIITNKWLRAKYGKKIRKYLKENFTIKKIIDFNGIRVFVGATVDTMIYIIKKEKPDREDFIFYNHTSSLDNIEQVGYKVKQSSLRDEVWIFVNEELEEIKNWIENIGTPLKDMGVRIYRGITTGFNEAFIIDDETRKRIIEEDPKSEELIKPLIRGRDVGRYYINWEKKWIITIPAGFTKTNLIGRNVDTKEAEEIFKERYPSVYRHFEQFKNVESNRGKGLLNRDDQGDYWWELRPCDYYQEFEKSKIVFSKIVKKPQFSFDKNGYYVEVTSYILNGSENLKYLLLFLNCHAVYNMFYKFYSGGGIDGEITINKLEELPIPLYLLTKISYYETLADYLLFLNAKENWREEYSEVITLLDKQIADSLVYELYFKEKFAEDGLYPEPKEYLLEALSKHLKPINYDRWANLYWKKQLEEDLTPGELRELEKLEKENLKTIEEVHKSLKEDDEVQKWIEKIKSYKWVKVIESGEESKGNEN